MSGRLRLVEPDPRLQASYLEALDELEAEGNSHYLDLVHPPESGYAGATFTSSTLRDATTFEEFCAHSIALSLPETPRPAGWVPATSLWAVLDDQVVGRVSLRHALTPWLIEVGGHIGYAVRPSARRRGIATEALRLMLPVAAARRIDPALVTCDEDNVGSRRVIEKNGGRLEDVRNGKMRFWVPTGSSVD